MSRLLLALDPLPAADEAFCTRLAFETGRPVAHWQRDLAVPRLARVLWGADSEPEARMWVERLGAIGLACRVVPEDAARAGMRGALEVARVEKRGAELVCVAADDRELALSATDVRTIVPGRGAGGAFIVLGLAREPSSVVLRASSTAMGELGRTLDDVVRALAAFAPQALLERGLEAQGEVPPALAALGTEELEHVATLSAWLVRLAEREDAERARRARAAAPGPSASAQKGELQQQAAQLFADAVRSSGETAAFVPGAATSTLMPASTSLGARVSAAAFVVVVVVAGLWWAAPASVPDSAAQDVRLGETWRTPYGLRLTFRHAYDSSLGVVSRAAYALEVRHADDVRFLSLTPGEKRDAVVFGTPIEATLDGRELKPTSVHVTLRAPAGGAPSAEPAPVRDAGPGPIEITRNIGPPPPGPRRPRAPSPRADAGPASAGPAEALDPALTPRFTTLPAPPVEPAAQSPQASAPAGSASKKIELVREPKRDKNKRRASPRKAR